MHRLRINLLLLHSKRKFNSLNIYECLLRSIVVANVNYDFTHSHIKTKYYQKFFNFFSTTIMFFFIIPFIFFSISQSSLTRMAPFRRNVYGNTTSPIHTSLFKKSSKACSDECTSSPYCMRINYRKDTKECFLYLFSNLVDFIPTHSIHDPVFISFQLISGFQRYFNLNNLIIP